MVVVSAPASSTGTHEVDVGRRRVTTPRGLPGGRAVVGGLLVAASAVGVFSAYGSAHAPPSDRYVVVARDLTPGEIVGVGDLRLVAINLPADQRGQSFTDPGVLVGTVTLGALHRGQLVQSTDVAVVHGGGQDAKLSGAVETRPALDGGPRDLRGGEPVGCVLSLRPGWESESRTVARDVTRRDVPPRDQRLG